jgi:hypothetical protein
MLILLGGPAVSPQLNSIRNVRITDEIASLERTFTRSGIETAWIARPAMGKGSLPRNETEA